MTVTVNLWLVIGIFLYLVIGATFAYKWAISPTAGIILLLCWPVFGVLAVLALPINWLVNRNIPNRKDQA